MLLRLLPRHLNAVGVDMSPFFLSGWCLCLKPGIGSPPATDPPCIFGSRFVVRGYWSDDRVTSLLPGILNLLTAMR